MKQLATLAGAVAVLLSGAGFHGLQASSGNAELPRFASAESRTADPAPAKPEEVGITADRSDETRSVVSGNTAFALDLYRQLTTDEDGNLFISPASLSAAFALAYAGAKEETARQIASTLHFKLPVTQFHRAMAQLLSDLQSDEKGRVLTVANAAWIDIRMEIERSYETLLQKHYKSALKRVNFRKRPQRSRREINRWVAESTRGKIRELLSAAHVGRDTRLVLVNAIYLKADWLNPFKSHKTAEEPFHLVGDDPAKVPTMQQVDAFRHLSTERFAALELPYEGGEMSAVIFLPNDKNGLAAFEAALSSPKLEDWLERLFASGYRPVDLKLPKLKFEAKYELAKPLAALGMILPFTDNADFSGMADPEKQQRSRREESVKIGHIVHQTVLDLDEKGTEAAAVTGITVIPTGAAAYPKPPVPFHADHPFFFLIRHNKSGAILFMGRIIDPR